MAQPTFKLNDIILVTMHAVQCKIDWQITTLALWFKLSWSWWSTKGGAVAPSAPLCLRHCLQPLILDLNFWHRSFLTTIMGSIITHSLRFPVILDSARSKIKNVHHDNYNQCVYKSYIIIAISSFMLICSFDTSTETSASAVLSLWFRSNAAIFQLHSNIVSIRTLT